MPSINTIAIDKLARLVGTPNAPVVIDIRAAAEIAAEPRSIPGALRRDPGELARWASDVGERSAVILCADGRAASHGIAALLRQRGGDAEVVEQGLAGWIAAGKPTMDRAAIPATDASGRTVWVTRARPKIDRIACPWLIRRFVDPNAVFLFVPAAEVRGVAERIGATPFDIEGDGMVWSHRGALCTFDVMVDMFGLGAIEPLTHLATIVRAADTARPDLAPEAAGLLAISLGLSRMYAEDIAQLEAGMPIYDALYRWCRDATDETHDWTSHLPTRWKARA